MQFRPLTVKDDSEGAGGCRYDDNVGVLFTTGGR